MNQRKPSAFMATNWNRVVFAQPGSGMSVFRSGVPWQRAWMEKLVQSGHKCQLPRGFFKEVKRPIFVGFQKPKPQHKNLGQQMMTDMRNEFAKLRRADRA